MKKIIFIIVFFCMLIASVQAANVIHFSKKIAAGSDDAGQQNAVMNLVGSQVYSGISSGIAYRKGFRFQNITIPKGAKIISANISYAVSSGGGTGVSTVIYGEASDNSATFSKTNNNITLRAKTTAKVSYNNPPKSKTKVYTPDLKSIVSEITNRSKWKSGNSMTFLFVEQPSSQVLSATNTFEASASAAPVLTVDYVLAAAAETNPPLWRNQTTNDADNIISQGQPITLSAEGFDDTGLHIAWLATNETGVWKNYTNNVIIWEDHDFWAGHSPGSPDYNSNYTYKNITNTLLSYGMYQVLGVIPNSTNGELLSTDSQMVAYLNLIKNQPTIEIALHGNTHVDNEFQNLSLAETLARLQGGIDVLHNTLGVNPTTFIPPNGVYNNAAISAYATKGFTRFSTYDYDDSNPYDYNPSSLLHVPITTEFMDWSVLPDGAMFDAATIEASCQAALDTQGICVLALHHDTFGTPGQQTVNQTRYQILLDVISWVMAKQDVDFKTTAQTSYIDMHDTPESMGDIPGTWLTSSFPWQSSVVPAGTNVGWRIYYEDTSGNVNMTDIKSFLVGAPVPTFPIVSIAFPLNNTNTSNTGIDVNYTVSVNGGAISSCWYSNDTFSKNTSLANCANIATVIWSQGTHNVIVYANSTTGNVNSSSVTFTVDSTPPYFTLIPPSANIPYSSGLGVDFNATDAGVGMGSFAINTSLFRINSSGWLTNSSPNMAIGSYYMNITINDILGNMNSTIYFVNITRAAAPLNLSATSPITYGTATNFVGSNCPSQLTCSLNITNGIYGAGTISANYSTAGNSNYTASSVVFTVVINKASLNFIVTLTTPIIYPTASNYAGAISNGEVACAPTLKRNGVLIGSGFSVSDTSVLQGGTYVYNYSAVGCVNYTNSEDTRTLAVNTVVCHNDSECNDGNPHTQDVCNNPGTMSSSCSHLPIACLSNNDCGVNAYINTPACQSNNVWQNFITYTCNSPGTISSSCSNSISFIQKEVCQYICTSGRCMILVCNYGTCYYV